ncbi:MAG: type I-U CRISPR-associated protein Csb2 [Pirellulales bacterium]
MNTTLCFSLRFIQPFPLYHGTRDAGMSEWPPSPMRAFQALINAACLRARGRALAPELRSALHVLEVLRPHIVAPRATISGMGYQTYVPHNQNDLVFMGLSRGMEQSTEAFRKLNGSVRSATKSFRPMRIETFGDDLPTIHYLYPLNAATVDPAALLRAILPSVRSVHCLGWGIDQVIADATLIDDKQAARLIGERWTPTTRGGQPLRVHRKGSLDALGQRYDRFLERLTSSHWTPVSTLKEDKDIDRVRYRRDTDPLPRPYAVFKLLDDNEDPARYPHAKLIHIAGMVRHLAIKAMTGSGADPEFVNRVIRGKRDPSSGNEHKQISYIPLPSIGHAHADGIIRNVMLVAPIGMERELADLARRIDGLPLKPEGEFEECKSDSSPTDTYRAELRLFTPPKGKFIDTHYLGTSPVWHTVTPVILDGHNKKSKNDKPEAIARETEKLICKALQRAGIETPCKFTWQALPFLKNCLSAHKYDRDGRHTGYHRPAHLKDLTAVHMRLSFEYAVPGPLTLGAGRHCGFGLMAGTD